MGSPVWCIVGLTNNCGSDKHYSCVLKALVLVEEDEVNGLMCQLAFVFSRDLYIDLHEGGVSHWFSNPAAIAITWGAWKNY